MWLSGFEASLVYIGSSRIARATQWEPVSKKQKQTKKWHFWFMFRFSLGFQYSSLLSPSVLLTESNSSYKEEHSSTLFNAGQKMSWTSLIVQSKQKRLKSNGTQRAWSGTGEAHVLSASWVMMSLLRFFSSRSKEGVSVSGATSLPPLQSSFHSRGSNFWYCTQKGNVYHWTVPSPQASSYYKHFDSFSSENILRSITSKDSTVIITLYNVLNSRGADMLR